MSNKVIYNGKEYKSIYCLCKEFGIHLSSVLYRLNRGDSLEDAVTFFINKNINGIGNKSVVYKGRTYYSLYFLCRKLGISFASVSYRIQKGETIEEAVDYFYHNKSTVEYNGVVYKNKLDLAKKLKINITTLSRRLMSGIPLEEAVSSLLNSNKNSGIVVNGIKYKSVAEACRVLGKQCNTVRMRLHNGWSIDEAFDIKARKIQTKPKQIKVEGVVYKSLSEACKKYNLCRSTVSLRLKEGWSIDEAFGIVKRKRSRVK